MVESKWTNPTIGLKMYPWRVVLAQNSRLFQPVVGSNMNIFWVNLIQYFWSLCKKGSHSVILYNNLTTFYLSNLEIKIEIKYVLKYLSSNMCAFAYDV